MSTPASAKASASAMSVALRSAIIRRKRVEGLSRIVRVERGARVVDQRLHAIHDDRGEQRLLRREVAVDGADADAGARGDGVDRHGEALRREHLAGRLEDARTVAARVCAQRLRRRRAQPFDNRNHRSVY